MSEDLFIKVGRVVYINFGPDAGKIAVVLDIITDSTILIDGPTTGVQRQVIPKKRIDVTKFYIKKVMRNQREGQLKKLIADFGLLEKWNATAKATRLRNQVIRASLTDFDRFKVVTLKRKVGRLMRAAVASKKTTKKTTKK